MTLLQDPSGLLDKALLEPNLLVPGRKPVGAVEIDWDHPLARGLTFTWIGGRELVTGKAPTTNNTTGIIAGQEGRAIDCSTGQVNMEWDEGFIKTGDGAGTGDFTMMCRANPISSSGLGHLFAQKNDAGGSPYEQAALLTNANGSASYSPGELCFFTYADDNTSVFITNILDGSWKTFTGVREGSTLKIAADDGAFTTNSGGIRDVWETDRYTALGSRGNGTTDSYYEDISWGFAWNRALTLREKNSIHADPFQFLKPSLPLVVMAPAAAGGPEAEVAMYHYMNNQ